MTVNEYEYIQADDIDQVFDLKEEHPNAELLAAGHTLLPRIKTGIANPDTVIDISYIDSMQKIHYGSDKIDIGAGLTYSDLIDSNSLYENVQVMAEAAAETGDQQVRNRATLGGNIISPDHVSDLPAAIIAADGVLIAKNPDGKRRIRADDFFQPKHEANLSENELLIRIELPSLNGTVGESYISKHIPGSRYTTIGVASRLQIDNDQVTDANVAANGVVNHGVRLESVEAVLSGAALSSEIINSAAKQATTSLNESRIIDDRQASAEFRVKLLEAYVRRSLKQSAKRVGIDIYM
jgi:carbon-monoxide dehydrogenase medium subunit